MDMNYETDINLIKVMMETLTVELDKKQIAAAYETASLIQWRVKRIMEITTNKNGKQDENVSIS